MHLIFILHREMLPRLCSSEAELAVLVLPYITLFFILVSFTQILLFNVVKKKGEGIGPVLDLRIGIEIEVGLLLLLGFNATDNICLF